jgi:hypothetical protein
MAERSEALKMFHHWDALPDELKLIVLEHYLFFPTSVTEKKHWCFVRLRLIPLIRAGNKQLALMAKAAYYRGNVFQITSNALDHGRCIGSVIGQFIQHLEFTLTTKPRDGLHYLLQPTPDQSSWQHNLPNIKTLHIVLEVQSKWRVRTTHTGTPIYRSGYLNKTIIERYRDVIKNNSLSLKPEHITFRIDARACPMGDEEHEGDEGCECDCATNLEKELLALMKPVQA